MPTIQTILIEGAIDCRAWSKGRGVAAPVSLILADLRDGREANAIGTWLRSLDGAAHAVLLEALSPVGRRVPGDQLSFPRACESPAPVVRLTRRRREHWHIRSVVSNILFFDSTSQEPILACFCPKSTSSAIGSIHHQDGPSSYVSFHNGQNLGFEVVVVNKRCKRCVRDIGPRSDVRVKLDSDDSLRRMQKVIDCLGHVTEIATASMPTANAGGEHNNRNDSAERVHVGGCLEFMAM